MINAYEYGVYSEVEADDFKKNKPVKSKTYYSEEFNVSDNIDIDCAIKEGN